ncbi:hypothetical protein IV203_018651 [Nitzschia inconspicua]|uniref:Uncharacterized protein n=1 Tax=Nitzschia inconspicua TaxID=303405 RepID=A0A9K3Q670_9STRA|nr:hypothetical protein IV203_018651 [Nitzschia inconspicua]
MQSSGSSTPALRQRSLKIPEDLERRDVVESRFKRTDAIPDIPLLQQISIQDRLWSSYTSIYDSDDEDHLPHPFANGYEHVDKKSVEALERMNFSMVDFSTSLDDSLQSILPYADEDEDSLSSNSSSEHSPLDKEDEEQPKLDVYSTPTESVTMLDKLDKKVFDPHAMNALQDITRLTHAKSSLAKNHIISITAIHRMNNRIRSRRRRQIAILRAAIAKKNETLETSKDKIIDSQRSENNQDYTQNMNTQEEKSIESKDEGSHRVSISSLTKRFEKSDSSTDTIESSSSDNSTHQIVSNQGTDRNHAVGIAPDSDDDDNETVRRSNQTPVMQRSGDQQDARTTLGVSLPLGIDVSLSSSLRSTRSTISERKSLQSKRSPGPILHRLPKRLTPSPTRMGRGSKSRQKTSFGNYFQMSKSCPSSPTVDKEKTTIRTQRVQFIGLSKPPNAGPMPSNRWLSVDDESKLATADMLDTTHHSSVVSGSSGDTRALPPKRKQSIDGFENVKSNNSGKTLSLRRSSLGSDIPAAIPARKKSNEKMVVDGEEASFLHTSPTSRDDNNVEDDDSVLLSLQEVDPLLANMLSRITTTTATVVPGSKSLPSMDGTSNDVRPDCAQSSTQSSGQTSKGLSLPVHSSSPPPRLDSFGSDQSSSDLLPYKPPIPDPSLRLEEYFVISKIPKNVGILSDSDSLSTHSVSTRAAESATRHTIQKIEQSEVKFEGEKGVRSSKKSVDEHLMMFSTGNSSKDGLPPSGRSPTATTTTTNGKNPMSMRGRPSTRSGKRNDGPQSSNHSKQRSKSRDDTKKHQTG